MSSTETEVTTPPATTPPATQGDDHRAAAILADLQKERTEKAELKSQHDALAARLQELEDKDKSDLEKATSEATRAKAEADQLKATAEAAEKRSKLRIELYEAGMPKAAIEEGLKLFELKDLKSDEDYSKAVEAKKTLLPGLFGEPPTDEETERLGSGPGDEGESVRRGKSKDDDRSAILKMMGRG